MSSQYPPPGSDTPPQGPSSGYPPPPGYAPPPPYGYGMPPVYVAPPPQTSGLAIASMVCGIIGLCSGIAGVAAVICGHLALSQIKKSNETIPGRGMAIAGLVMGYIGIALTIVFIGLYIAYIVFFVSVATHLPHYPYLTPTPYGASPSGSLTCQQPITRHWESAPPMQIDPHKQYTATVHTTKGDIVIALDAKDSPIAVNNFVFLAEHNYYCGTYFWRVEKPGQISPLDGQPSQLSLIQGGAVSSDGTDSVTTPGYTIKDEPVVGDYTTGSVAMAKTTAPNSASSQFFIDTADESQFFAKTYQIFGHVTAGMDVAQTITAGDVMDGVTVTAQ